MTKSNAKNSIEVMLMVRPHRPRSKCRLRSGSLRHRLRATQAIEIRYDVIKALRPSEQIWLNAMLDPILIRERKTEMSTVVIMLASGICNFSGTFRLVSD